MKLHLDAHNLKGNILYIYHGFRICRNRVNKTKFVNNSFENPYLIKLKRD